jgi:hypothetical protein
MRPGWSVSYVDVNPSGHSSDLESLREEPVQQQPSHPLYKTRLCTHIGPCPRGDRCPFAHGPSELRVPRTALSAPSYQFAVALQRPDQHTLEFCNLDGHPQKSEAKADCAAQCIRALGLKVAGNKLVDDDSWVTAGTRSESPPLFSSASLQHHPAQDGGARPPIPAWRKRQLIELVGRLNKSETVREAAREGYDRWIACIGGMFGSSEPRLAQALRLHYGSFKEFVSVHAGQIPHPRPPAPVASQDHSVSTGIVNAGAAAITDFGATRIAMPAESTAAGNSGIDLFVTLLCAWIRTRGEQRVTAAQLGDFYAAHPSVDRSVLPANKKLEYLCGHAEARGRLWFQNDPNVSGGGWLEIVTSPLPEITFSPSAASLAAFHRELSNWIRARGGRVHAACIGQFYAEHPEFDEEFKGKWKPSRHCMRDGCLNWVSDEDAPGNGWIDLPGNGWLRDRVPCDDEQMLHDGAAPIESTDDPLIVWLTSTRNLHLPGEELQLMQQPHPAVLDLVQAAGPGGIEVVTLRGQLELGLRLRKTIKTPRLVVYLKACPTAFHVSETAGVSGIIHRVHALHLVRPSSSAAWQHASRFTRTDSDVASSLDAIYEFLDSQGINLQTIELMTPNELVGLGLAPDDARRVLSEARHGGVEEYDGDVYADLEAAESAEIAELRGQNASLQQRVKELMQRCSDLQLRVSVLEEARMCCICMERKRDIVLMPCMHAMFCSTCLRGSARVTSCPTCRGPIAGLIECRFDMIDEQV